jgi:hypothetical protein
MLGGKEGKLSDLFCRRMVTGLNLDVLNGGHPARNVLLAFTTQVCFQAKGKRGSFSGIEIFLVPHEPRNGAVLSSLKMAEEEKEESD